METFQKKKFICLGIVFMFLLTMETIAQSPYGWRGSTRNGIYPETRTTPAIDRGKAYVISGSGEIICLSIANGDIVWKSEALGETGVYDSPMLMVKKI